MTLSENIIGLLRRYLECAEQIAQELRSELGVTDLIAGVNSGAIQRRGSCKSFGGGEYYFHGVGCRVNAAEIELDFDFGPNGSLPGADPWKLYSFADAHAEAYPWLPTREGFDAEIKQLIERGALRRLNVPPSPHLVCQT